MLTFESKWTTYKESDSNVYHFMIYAKIEVIKFVVQILTHNLLSWINTQRLTCLGFVLSRLIKEECKASQLWSRLDVQMVIHWQESRKWRALIDSSSSFFFFAIFFNLSLKWKLWAKHEFNCVFSNLVQINC